VSRFGDPWVDAHLNLVSAPTVRFASGRVEPSRGHGEPCEGVRSNFGTAHAAIEHVDDNAGIVIVKALVLLPTIGLLIFSPPGWAGRGGGVG
jgi:hypothetical protein